MGSMILFMLLYFRYISIFINFFGVWFNTTGLSRNDWFNSIDSSYSEYGSVYKLLAIGFLFTPIFWFTLDTFAAYGFIYIKNITTKDVNKKYDRSKRWYSQISYLNDILLPLEVKVDNLFDKVLPSLGFNIERNKTIRYGKQSFTLQLLSDSYLEIIDNTNHKILKELPDAIEGDDERRVIDAKKDLINIRNSLDAIINYQKEKLKKVMFNGRKWDYETFFEVFVENPIMQYFTFAFIWGVYDEYGHLIDCFRYMEDGSLSSIEEDLYELPQKIKYYISLYHPADSDEEYYQTWKKQIELYEIMQPIDQIKLGRNIIQESDIENNAIISFKGKKISLKYMDKLLKELDIKAEYFNEYASYYLLDNILNIACEINCVLNEEDLVIDNIKFYELGEHNRFGNLLSPFDIAPRFISTMIYYLSLGNLVFLL